MDESLVVGECQGISDLRNQFNSLLEGRSVPCNAISEVLAIDQVADDENRAVISTDIMDRHNAGMSKAGDLASFLQKQFRTVERHVPPMARDLHGDRPLQLRVEAPEYTTVSTLGD